MTPRRRPTQPESAISTGITPDEVFLASLPDAPLDELGFPPFAFDTPEEQIPDEDTAIRAGDPDADPLDNEYVGDALPGGGAGGVEPNDPDSIGAVYGVPEGEGGLRLGDELLVDRDTHRWDAEYAGHAEARAASPEVDAVSDEESELE
jgi:hypothetical protein